MFWKLKAWYYGRRDGKLGMPPRDEETPAPFEQRVCAAAERTVSASHRKWKTKDARLKGVTVYVGGAKSAERDKTDERALEVRRFWELYIKETGADLKEYGQYLHHLFSE